MVTLFVMVLGVTPAHASKLVIWVSVAAVAGRFLCSWISDSMGRRASGLLSCLLAGLFMSLAGYLNSVFVAKELSASRSYSLSLIPALPYPFGAVKATKTVHVRH